MLEYQTIRRVAAEVVLLAYHDAQRLQPQAVAWLASSAAEAYFDLLGIPQSRFLKRSSWRRYATEVLSAPPEAPEDQLRTISVSLSYLEAL